MPFLTLKRNVIRRHPVINKFTGYLLPIYWTAFFFLNSRSRHWRFNIGVYRINVRIGNTLLDQRITILRESHPAYIVNGFFISLLLFR